MSTDTAFKGFTAGTYSFFSGLCRENSKIYFDRNRAVYDADVVAPAKQLVQALAPFFNHLNAAIRTEPKFNQTIMRMNNDMRFSKGKPYKEFLLVHFGRFKMDSEFYCYVDKDGLSLGLFINRGKGENLHFRENLEKYPAEIAELFTMYGLNGKLTLSEIAKTPVVVKKNFDARKHFSLLHKPEYLLLERNFTKTARLATSAALVTEMIRLSSRLYPLYCYAISPRPQTLVARFEDEMGVAG